MGCTGSGALEALAALAEDSLGYLCKPSRAEHSRSVAAMAAALCGRFGVDPRRGTVAGLSHDLMKDQPISSQWSSAREASGIAGLGFVAAAVSRIEAEPAFADKIIHGPAAAVYLYRELEVRDDEILEAVAFHSSAAARMSPLAKIVFISDKIEPKRPYVTREDLEKAGTLGLDELMIHALQLSMGWLERKDHAIAQSTIDLYNALTVRETDK